MSRAVILNYTVFGSGDTIIARAAWIIRETATPAQARQILGLN